ncbi:MAG: hypothetical protein IRY91_01065, partial [Gemmatimonadaceae bacterium]|nr:hypothetical protein [Gemmatimonadaceae bacterium]
PDVNHQLNVLKALADQVAQKIAALEQQREAVERATGHAAQVVALSAQVETALRRQEEHTRVASALEAKLNEVQALHASVLTRSEIMSTNQRALEDAGRDAARALAELREQMHASTERFELEIRSVDAASERIAELRASVKECETRMAALDAATRAIADTEAQVRALAAQVTTVSEDVSRIAQHAERLRAVRDDVGELDRTLTEMTQRVERVEQIRPTLDVIGRDLATLNGAHEAIRDGLEQVRLAYAEMSRLRERQAETDGWLSDADVRMRALQTSVTELERLRPFIDTLRGDVNQLIASTDAVEARRGMVDELHRRLGELDATAAQLHERTEGVRARMDAAEARFIDLAGQAAEAQRVAATIASVAASVEEAERRMTAVAGSVDTLEAHAKALDGMEDRLRLFGQEIEQRQKALDAAAEHLARASTLRREAADAAQHLEEVTRTIAAQLGTAETRTGSLEQALRDLEARSSALGELDTRMARFEALLGKWEVAQNEASQALEQIASRQSMIDAVNGQINHALEIAERTMEHVQSIVAARRDVEETRELLEGMRAQLADANTAMHDFTERKRQVDDLERRLARADALAMDVRSTVEAIAAQRSLVDQVLERSGTLTFQMKQAEALTEALRTECLLATRLREAVTGLRENGSSDA